MLNISDLTSFTEANGWTNSTLQATNGSTVEDSSLTSLTGVNLSIGGASTIATAQITSYTGGSISVSGGSPSFANLATFTSSNITVSGGGTVSLPKVTSYTGSGGNNVFEATGTNSSLNLANLATVTESSNAYQAQVMFEALAGGTVSVSTLKTIDTGTVVLEADGSSSVLDVSALTGFTGANGWTNSTLQASSNGTVDDGSLSSLSGVNVNIVGPGENLTLANLTSFTNGNITVSGGAALSLPKFTSYTGNGGNDVVQATGTSSSLTWPTSRP